MDDTTLTQNSETQTQDTNLEAPTPSEDKSRTAEQFEKLKESNQELKKERDHYRNVLDSLTPEAATPTQRAQAPQTPQADGYTHLKQEDIDAVYTQMVDADGYLDGGKLVNTLKEMDSRARAAEQRALQIEQHLKLREEAETQARKTELMRKVHELYPQLDPERAETFDAEFYDAVRNELIGQIMTSGQEDPMAAAEKWSKKLYRDIEMDKKEKAIKEEKQEQKAQINATNLRSPSLKGYYEKAEEGDLREKIKHGKKGALAELLRRRGQ